MVWGLCLRCRESRFDGSLFFSAFLYFWVVGEHFMCLTMKCIESSNVVRPAHVSTDTLRLHRKKRKRARNLEDICLCREKEVSPDQRYEIFVLWYKALFCPSLNFPRVHTTEEVCPIQQKEVHAGCAHVRFCSFMRLLSLSNPRSTAEIMLYKEEIESVFSKCSEAHALLLCSTLVFHSYAEHLLVRKSRR